MVDALKKALDSLINSFTGLTRTILAASIRLSKYPPSLVYIIKVAPQFFQN